jgi:hypothetical protein
MESKSNADEREENDDENEKNHIENVNCQASYFNKRSENNFARFSASLDPITWKIYSFSLS